MPYLMRCAAIVICFASALAASSLAVAAPGSDDKPNVVLILMDNSYLANALYQVREDHEASIEEDPGAPGP